jgi:hypothetical protein
MVVVGGAAVSVGRSLSPRVSPSRKYADPMSEVAVVDLARGIAGNAGLAFEYGVVEFTDPSQGLRQAFIVAHLEQAALEQVPTQNAAL